jgi:hypothetical protein
MIAAPGSQDGDQAAGARGHSVAGFAFLLSQRFALAMTVTPLPLVRVYLCADLAGVVRADFRGRLRQRPADPALAGDV